MILADFEIVEAHDVLGVEAGEAFASTAQVATAPRFFDLSTMWRRGRYAPSLFADSDARSFAWLGRAVSGGMPMLPMIDERPLDTGKFWPRLARENAREEHGIQKRSRLKLSDFTRIRQSGEQHDLLYRLPRWVAPGDKSIEPAKLYWSDPGLLHSALGWDARRFEGNLAGLSSLEIKRLQTTWKQDSWEGFVVTSLVRCAGVRAKASVWRGPDGEIDLILNWTEARETWAVEVTMGRKKDLRSLGLGQNLTQASRAFVVYNQQVACPRLDGLTRYGGAIDCVTLSQALRAVRAGP